MRFHDFCLILLVCLHVIEQRIKDRNIYGIESGNQAGVTDDNNKVGKEYREQYNIFL